MKKTIILLLMILSIIGCDKGDPPKSITELDKLPPATQTGANRVGCLLDGKAFMPGDYPNSRQCFYQYVNGEYYFVVEFDNEDSKFNLTALGVGTQKLQINQGFTYDLLELSDNNAYGGYIYQIKESFTSHTHTGKLTITRLDPVNYIVSGTFWYDVEDQDGIVHQIREGRFDMHYTN